MMDRMEKEPLIQEGRRLPDVADIDGLVSFMGRLTEEQESFYLDLLLASLVRLHPFIKSDDVKRMMPVFEWAGTVMEMPESETGGLDKLTASFLLDYAEMLSGAEKRAKGAKQQPYQDYKPYLDLVKLAFNRIKDYNTLPLLSTPTHRPAWIDPSVLVSRLSEYQKKGIKPDSLDFQIALSRVALDDTDEAVRSVEQALAGEYRELLLFLFKPEARPKGAFTFQAVWMTAALVKSPDTIYDEFEDFPYSAVNRAYLTGDIPCDVFIFEKPFGKVDRILQLIPPASKNVAIKWRFGGYALYMTYRPCSRIPLLVETFWKIPLREKDLRRFLLLSPNAPRIWLALLVRDRVRDAYWNDLELARLNLVALETLRELDLEWRGGMALTYLAVCLLSIDRPVRLCAADLWGELVEKDLIDNVALGRVLGKIQSLEWAPAQRISGLVVEMLINRSSFHNKELSVLFVSFLSCLPESPVKDLKRLLEVFAELQTVNNWPKITYAPLLSLLETWKKNSKLTEIIESLY